MVNKLKRSELKQWRLDNTPKLCPLCGRKTKYVESRNLCVDHDHKTGMIRDVLCRNCNSLEGKIHNLCIRAGTWVDNIKFLENLIKYWKRHRDNPSNILHPDAGKKKTKKKKWRR